MHEGDQVLVVQAHSKVQEVNQVAGDVGESVN